MVVYILERIARSMFCIFGPIAVLWSLLLPNCWRIYNHYTRWFQKIIPQSVQQTMLNPRRRDERNDCRHCYFVILTWDSFDATFPSWWVISSTCCLEPLRGHPRTALYKHKLYRQTVWIVQYSTKLSSSENPFGKPLWQYNTTNKCIDKRFDSTVQHGT